MDASADANPMGSGRADNDKEDGKPATTQRRHSKRESGGTMWSHQSVPYPSCHAIHGIVEEVPQHKSTALRLRPRSQRKTKSTSTPKKTVLGESPIPHVTMREAQRSNVGRQFLTTRHAECAPCSVDVCVCTSTPEHLSSTRACACGACASNCTCVCALGVPVCFHAHGSVEGSLTQLRGQRRRATPPNPQWRLGVPLPWFVLPTTSA